MKKALTLWGFCFMIGSLAGDESMSYWYFAAAIASMVAIGLLMAADWLGSDGMVSFVFIFGGAYLQSSRYAILGFIVAFVAGALLLRDYSENRPQFVVEDANETRKNNLPIRRVK